MPARLVVLAEEVLFQGGAGAPGHAWFEAVARLAHAGHPVAVVLAGQTPDRAAPLELQQLAHEAGGQVVAFFHRSGRPEGLADVLAEVTDRWRVDPGQVHGVFSRVEDLACVLESGAHAVLLEDLVDDPVDPPPGCSVHADLGAFADTLLDEAESAP